MPFHKETYLIAANRARFEPLIKFAIPTTEQINQVDDKGTLARLCQQRRLPIPETAVADSAEEFRSGGRNVSVSGVREGAAVGGGGRREAGSRREAGGRGRRGICQAIQLAGERLSALQAAVPRRATTARRSCSTMARCGRV